MNEYAPSSCRSSFMSFTMILESMLFVRGVQIFPERNEGIIFAAL